MPKDFGDVGSEDGDDVPQDADFDDVPAEPQVNGSMREETATKDLPPTPGETQDEDDDSDEGEEYQVESILEHKKTKGEIRYRIKWVGYPHEQNTWEPEENLLPHSRAVLQAYYDNQGGEAVVKKSLKNQRSVTALRRDDSTDGTPSAKRRKTEEDDGTYLPKKTDWTSEVDAVQTIERDETGQLQVYLLFKNGKKTRVSMESIKKHCPVPMLEFYEEHLKFKSESQSDI